eukprot:GFUD01136384.1.p1 GENE.GFUD01136384.1~~GFUD01136384.1.p1  ORF type:complete len:200 (+),score=33.94 GFUD01136384.1:41-640(+)
MPKIVPFDQKCEYEKDRDLNIAELNQEFESIFGYSRQQSGYLRKEKCRKKAAKSPKHVKPTRSSSCVKSRVKYLEEDISKKDKKFVVKVLFPKVVVDYSVKSNQNSDGVDSDNIAAFVCSECSRSFKFQNSLIKHVTTSHKNIVFQCEVCEKSYNSEANLKRHIVVADCESKVKYECGQCSKSFMYSSTLKRHNIKHHL